MAESVRELVVVLSLQTDKFKDTCTAINAQIKGVQAEFNALTGGTDAWQTTMEGRNAKLASLNETLALQQQKITEIREELEKATKALEGDQTLAGAKKVSNLETQLNNAKTAAALTKAEIEKINAISLQQFGAKLTAMGQTLRGFGRKFSMYIGGPLAALGIKAFNTAAEYETAFVSMQKTVEETGTTTHEMISDAFLAYSEEAPVAYTELMELAGAAGSLGVGADQVVEFVKAIAMISATADDLDASTGATALAQFLNVVEGGDFANINNAASAVTALGNATSATEGMILEMAQRMASAGELAGFSTAQILGLAAGFTSVGINAEAGGSAAGKLMKRMQIAAEVGTKSMTEFADGNYTAGMSIRDMQLAMDTEGWVGNVADDMGLTKEEVKGMIDSMVQLQQFADVSGTSLEGFAAGWDENAGATMLSFFEGLNKLELEGGEDTVITKLNEMGLTEIRLSNLIASATNNPELFASALALADASFEQNTALMEEAAKRYETAASFLTMQWNQADNAAADVGENVQDVFQPVIDKVTNLVAKFGELPEDVQTRWVLISAALVALGPVSGFIGTLASGVGNLVGHIAKVKLEHATNLTAAANGLTQMGGISSLGFFGLAAGVGALGIALTAAFSTSTDDIIASLKNIKISIDEESKQQALDAIAQVQAAADRLSGKEFEAQYSGMSAAVQAGYGTSEMFGQAVGYEKEMAERRIAEASATYAPKIAKYNADIVAAVKAGDREAADGFEASRVSVQAEWDASVAATQEKYAAAMSALVDGMMAKNPELAAALEQAVADYNVFAALQKATETNTAAGWETLFTPEIIAAYMPDAKSFEAIMESSIGAEGYGEKLRGILVKKLTEGMAAAAVGEEGSLIFTLLQTLMEDPGNLELLDFSAVTGAFEGALKLIDFKASGGEGKNLTQGLADAITGTTSVPVAATNAMSTAMINALRTGFESHSPSQVTYREGVNVALGIQAGILAGIPQATAAMNALGAAITAVARAKGTEAGRAYGAAFSSSVKTQFYAAIAVIQQELIRLNARILAGYGKIR